MKTYTVKIANGAVEDLDKIYDYKCNKLLSPQSATSQYDRIADTILSLSSNPERNRLLEMDVNSDMKLRRLLVDNYSVFYTIKNDEVFVTDVIYGACDYESKLRGLKIKDE